LFEKLKFVNKANGNNSRKIVNGTSKELTKLLKANHKGKKQVKEKNAK
jgi:hypothetical protein